MNTASPSQNNLVIWDAGINFSIPVHDDLLKTHALAVGLNTRIARKYTAKFNFGIRIEYEYRFARTNIQDSLIKSSANYCNFGLICIKPGIQLNLTSGKFWGIETGIGYVISDWNSKTGFGFVEEYDGSTQTGFCATAFFGKYIYSGTNKKMGSLSVYCSNFFAERHAENFAGVRLNYIFKGRN